VITKLLTNYFSTGSRFLPSSNFEKLNIAGLRHDSDFGLQAVLSFFSCSDVNEGRNADGAAFA